MSHHGWTPFNVAGPHEQQNVTNGRAKESVVHTQKIMFVPFLGATVYSTIPYGNVKIRCTSFSKHVACAFVDTMRQSWTAVFIDRVPTYFAGLKGHHSDLRARKCGRKLMLPFLRFVLY